MFTTSWSLSLCLVYIFAFVVAIVRSDLAPSLSSSSRRHHRRDALDRPNFVLFFVDDLGYGDLSYTGHPTVQTPNIDKLAWNGKILTTWYSGCSVCSCSRASLLTGRTYLRYGMVPVMGPTDRNGLNLNETTIAEQLKKVNYTTAIVGKYHLGQRLVYLPGNQGFDYYLGIPYSDDMGDGKYSSCRRHDDDGQEKYDDDGTTTTTFPQTAAATPSETKGEGKDNKHDPAGDYLPLIYQEHNRTRIVEQPVDLTSLSQKYNDFAINFIETNRNSPFLLYMPFSHVHVTTGRTCDHDVRPNKQYANCDHQNTTKRGPFGDALAEVDWMVGNVHETLKRLGLEENTLILFTSDNGPWTIKGVDGGSAGVFTGSYAGYKNTAKGSTWEGGIRMPAFAHWKGQIPPFSRSSETISSLDVFPTFSRLANVPLPPNVTMDGRDMVDVLLRENGKSKHDFLFFYGFCNGNYPKYGASAVRHGPYKAHFCTQPGAGTEGSIVHYDKYPLLFNVDEDPSEAFPLCTGKAPPRDAAAAAAMTRIQRAYAMEKATFQYGDYQTIPDGPGEGPGRYGLCCNRTTNCNCQTTTVGIGGGLSQVGTRLHHDRYHEVLGEANHMENYIV